MPYLSTDQSVNNKHCNHILIGTQVNVIVLYMLDLVDVLSVRLCIFLILLDLRHL